MTKLKQNSDLKDFIDNLLIFMHATGHMDMTELHVQWFNLIMDVVVNGQELTLQAHRNSYKTTTVIFVIATIMVVMPNTKILLARKNDELVKELVQAVSRLLKTDIFQKLGYSLYNTPLKLIRDNAHEIDTNYSMVVSKESQLESGSVLSGCTGKHYDVIINDDIIAAVDAQSAAARKQTDLFYQELINLANEPFALINCGTPWHEQDTFRLMSEPLKWTWRDTEIMSEARIEGKRRKMTPRLFAANYELKHIIDDELLFMNIVEKELADIDRSEMFCLAHVDCSYYGADNTALTLMFLCSVSKRIYIYGNEWSKGIGVVYEQISNLLKQYNAKVLYLENNADKGLIAEKFRKDRLCVIKQYHENINKYVKITSFIFENIDKLVLLSSALNSNSAYNISVKEYYDQSEHDDAPDSLASLLREARRHINAKMNQRSA